MQVGWGGRALLSPWSSTSLCRTPGTHLGTGHVGGRQGQGGLLSPSEVIGQHSAITRHPTSRGLPSAIMERYGAWSKRKRTMAGVWEGSEQEDDQVLNPGPSLPEAPRAEGRAWLYLLAGLLKSRW